VTKNTSLLIAVVATAAAVAAFWFFALSPKRDEVAALDSQIANKQTELSTAKQTLAGYEKSKSQYGKNYTTVVRLGKAVPEDDDVRSLLVQLDADAGGTNVDFRTIQIGGAGGATSTPAADPATAGTTTATPPPGAVSVGSAGFSAMPFSFSFRGSYANLSQFLARMEKFVTVRNENVNVTGRLLRLESIALQVDQKGFPNIRAQIGASSYLVPADQGLTAGATPQGPAATTATATTPAGGPSVPTTTATVGATR
jgi:Tfp pilus assembly protein PilO